MIFFPPRENKQLIQTNRSKIEGNLWASFGLDLQSELGLIKLSPRLKLNIGGAANQGLSVAFRQFDQRIFTIAGTRIFKNQSDDLFSAFVEDASTNVITSYSPDYSDIEIFNNTLVATSTTELWSKAVDGLGTGVWTQRDTGGGVTGLTTNTLHKLLYFKKTNRLYYFDSNQYIYSFYTDWTQSTTFGAYAIDFSTSFIFGLPYTMNCDNNDIWIGMMNTVPGGILDHTKKGSICRWDGVSSTVTSEYKIKAQGVLALCKDDRGIMHAMDTNGALLRFNGDGFDEIGRLPLNREYLTNACSTLYNGFIHPNGFTFSRNGTFLVMINNLIGNNGGTIKENLASGIWEWSEKTGFIHRQALSYSPLGSAGYTDFGQNRISQAGALSEIDLYSDSVNGKSTLICGAKYFSDASTAVSGIFVDDPLNTTPKFGYFVTSWIHSQNLKDAWQKIALRYRKFLDTADRIWAKYRLTEAVAVEFNMTWVSTSSTQATFTTTTDISGKVGYEVEVVQGTGSGKCAHIVSIANNAGIYTVVLDEPFTGVTTGTAKGRYQAWKKVMVAKGSQTLESLVKSIVNAKSEKIQLKVCMQFTGEDELHEAVLINAPHTLLE